MEHKEIMKKKKTWKCGVHSIKESSEKARLNVDEQQDDESDIDDSDKVQEITAARTPLKK